jgi:hypothetical protein
MFTIEMDADETSVQILDDNGNYEDIGMFLYDEVCVIRQWNEEKEGFEVILLSPNMFAEMMASYHKAEGAYITERVNGNN